MTEERPVVWISHKDGEGCSGCGDELGSGRFIVIRRDTGIRCMKCAGLDGLVFLGSGDAALTRRAVALSSRHAVVVKFSKARKRNERQGVLVEEAAIEGAKARCDVDASARKAARKRRRAREEVTERDYLARFKARILELFPGCPPGEAEAIAKRACQKYSGRVGRSQAAKELEPKAVELAVRAHVRHGHTEYDELMSKGMERSDARPLVRADIESVLAAWRAK